MIRANALPRLFIGSSAEALDVAYAIQENLEFDAETTVWSQGFFNPSANALNELMVGLARFDFAAFVFAPDDTVRMRGREHAAVRDNVIFELGLFFGALGMQRCFFVAARSHIPLHLPTDLLGVAPLTFSSQRSDGNLVAALGPACNRIRRMFRMEIRKSEPPPAATPGTDYRLRTIQEYVDAWDGPEYRRSRENIRYVTLDPYSDEFAAQRPDVERIFAFLEGLSDAVLEHAVDEGEAREKFERSILSFWPVAATMLAPPNHVDEWWDPPPKLAMLCARWKASVQSQR